MMSTKIFNNEKFFVTTHTDSKQIIFFKGKDIATALGYKDTDDAIRKHVKDKYKKTFNNPVIIRGNPRATFITEPGVYSLIFSSKLPAAEEFQDWVFSEVLPAIRKNGYYIKFNNNPLVFKVENEYDLHTKTVEYIRRFHPTAIITAGLGELQDTKSKRIKSYCKGYQKGQPDLIINNCHRTYRGFCIEFKSPTGKGILSESQKSIISSYTLNGFKCLVSNDYDLIIKEINDYFQNVRLPCPYCKRKFKTEQTLQSHERHFHRVHPNSTEVLSNLS